MTARKKLLLAAAAAGLLLVAFFALRPASQDASEPGSNGAPTRGAASGGAGGVAGSAGAAQGAGPGGAAGGAAQGPNGAVAQPGGFSSDPSAGAGKSGAVAASSPAMGDPSAPRVMPYRPARYLRFSDDAPAADPSKDGESAALQRVIQIAQPDPGQEKQIREVWRAHEDGRRALVATAQPRVSGPPILDPGKVAELDFRFESTVISRILRDDQRERLVREIYPQHK